MLGFKTLGLVLVLVFLTAAVAVAEPASPPAIDRARLETFVDRTVAAAMRDDKIPGVSVAIVDRSGPLLIKGYGIAAPGRAVDADTLFPMQSISKTMVWIALMQLVEQGKTSLDDPVNAHLPAGLRIPDEGFKQPILIRHLMSHTAGFEDSDLGHLFVDRPERLQSLQTYLATHRVHRVREPGRVVVYSNFGGALGGAIVSQVSGMPWEDYAEQKILRPLGMGEATFRQPYPAQLAKARGLPPPMAPDVAARLTDGFRRGAKGPEVGPREFTADVPAGALVASATNMAAYMRALLDPDLMQRTGVLKAQTLLDMRAPLVPGPAGFGDVRHGFEPVSLPGGIDAFGHGGDSLYQVATMSLVPSLGLGVFVSTNSANGRPLTMALRERLAAEFYGATLAPPVYGPGAAADARSHEGDYRYLRRAYFRTERGIFDLLRDTVSVSAAPNGDLRIGSFVGGSRAYVPLGDGVYRDKTSSERVAFRRLNGRMAFFDPYRVMAAEPIGYFDSPGWDLVIIGLTLLAATAVVIGAGLRLFARRAEAGFERYAVAASTASAAAWLAGFGLFGAMLVKALTATDIVEIMWWYPPATLIWACWAFAAAAALTLAALPGLAVVGRPNGWPAWRKGAHAVTLLIFLACAATLWRLRFVGFSGW
jgi:CubicO group peptidase (beta-lactamase class C family)